MDTVTRAQSPAKEKFVSSIRLDGDTRRWIKVLAALTGETQGELLARLVLAELDSKTVWQGR